VQRREILTRQSTPVGASPCCQEFRTAIAARSLISADPQKRPPTFGQDGVSWKRRHCHSLMQMTARQIWADKRLTPLLGGRWRLVISVVGSYIFAHPSVGSSSLFGQTRCPCVGKRCGSMRTPQVPTWSLSSSQLYKAHDRRHPMFSFGRVSYPPFVEPGRSRAESPCFSGRITDM
jgi:hypothetical protein